MTERTVYQVIILNTDDGVVVNGYFTNEELTDIQTAIMENLAVYDTLEELAEVESSDEDEVEIEEEDEWDEDEDDEEEDDGVQRGEG